MKNQLIWALSLFVLFMSACKAENPKEGAAATTTADSTATTPPAEFADMKYGEIVKNGLASLSKGDVAAWMPSFADNAVYAFNNGDSLAGKAAISEYWTQRRTEIIDSLAYKNEIFLPIKVNTPQSVEAPGVWVLAWAECTAKYKLTGKKMTQWIHYDTHFDANGKIDRWIEYHDEVPIKAAMTK